ncbi:unnamed protein product, partial [Phaeothamnion confervicola]
MAAFNVDPKVRARDAILGAFVADSATSGLHWIYDTSKIDDLLKGERALEHPFEFYDPPSCPFYSSTVGNLSPWGHELVPLLTSLKKRGEPSSCFPTLAA